MDADDKQTGYILLQEEGTSSEQLQYDEMKYDDPVPKKQKGLRHFLSNFRMQGFSINQLILFACCTAVFFLGFLSAFAGFPGLFLATMTMIAAGLGIYGDYGKDKKVMTSFLVVMVVAVVIAIIVLIIHLFFRHIYGIIITILILILWATTGFSAWRVWLASS